MNFGPLERTGLWEGWLERTWRLALANKLLYGVCLSELGSARADWSLSGWLEPTGFWIWFARTMKCPLEQTVSNLHDFSAFCAVSSSLTIPLLPQFFYINEGLQTSSKPHLFLHQSTPQNTSNHLLFIHIHHKKPIIYGNPYVTHRTRFNQKNIYTFPRY